MRVALVRGPLVDGLGFRHDAVGAYLALLRDLGADDDEIVELEVLVVVENDPELTGRAVLGAQHPSDAAGRMSWICHAASPGSPERITAARSSR